MALERRLNPNVFVVRRTAYIDAGVDATVELRIHGEYTNMFSQVQIKSCAKAKVNRDGSISYPIEVSNLNYILNGPSPLYMLFIKERKEVRYIWARDERNRIEKNNTNWKDQDTITIHFREVLDKDSRRKIAARIQREARIERQVRDTLSRTSLVEDVSITINQETQFVSDPDVIKDILLHSGITLVSSGHARLVVELIERLSPADKRRARISLVHAYAEYLRSRYAAATALLMDASAGTAELSAADQEFLTFLQDACDLQEGRISLEEFGRREREAATKGSTHYALSRRLHFQREMLIASLDERKWKAILPTLRQTTAAILESPDCSQLLKIQAKIALMHGEGVAALSEWTYHLSIALSRPNPRGVYEALQTGNAAIRKWTSGAIEVVSEAFRTENPQVIADALYARALIMFAHLSYNILVMGEEIPYTVPLSKKMASVIIPDMEMAASFYGKTGYLEGELRSKILLADYCDLVDLPERAKALAAEVLPVAKAYRMTDMAMSAEGHINGAAFHRVQAQRAKIIKHQDEDVRNANLTEADLDSLAEHCLAASGLTSEHRLIVRSECESLRAIAKERLNWCKFIALEQHLEHTQYLATPQATGSVYYCRCEKLKYESKIHATEWSQVIRGFKLAYCQGCLDREPKQPRSSE